MGDGWIRRDPQTGKPQKKSFIDELAEACGVQVVLLVLALAFSSLSIGLVVFKLVTS